MSTRFARHLLWSNSLSDLYIASASSNTTCSWLSSMILIQTGQKKSVLFIEEQMISLATGIATRVL